MKILNDIQELQNISQLKSTGVTIGVFDGLHLGHRYLCEYLINESKKRQLSSVVITFDTHPKEFFGHKVEDILTTNIEKTELFNTVGVDFLLTLTFESLVNLSPDEFVEKYLIESLKMKYLVVGEDFGFGKNRSGNVEVLNAWQDKYEYKLEVLDKTVQEADFVSSSLIRKLIQQGIISKANKILGYNYFLTGKVIFSGENGFEIEVPNTKLVPSQMKFRVSIDNNLDINDVYIQKSESGEKTKKIWVSAKSLSFKIGDFVKIEFISEI